MNCWLRLASSAQKICNSIFCGSRGELPSTHCAFLGQFHNTSQYFTILHNTTTVLPRSIPQQLIRRCVWVALWRRDHPPPPPIRNPAFPFAQSAFSRPALQVQGAVFKCRFLTFSMHIEYSAYFAKGSSSTTLFSIFSMWPSVAISGRRCGISLEIFRRWYFWQLWWDSNRRQSKANIGSLLDRCTAIIIGWQFV